MRCSSVGPFMCGGCAAILDTACDLHVHMTSNHADGSYHYDNLIKTAFPKYDSFCATTQTSKKDKHYLKSYKKNKRGGPPKLVDGLNIETEICEKYVVIKEDEHIPQTTPIVQEQSFTQQQNTPPPYNFRPTSDKRPDKYNCYVAIRPLKLIKYITDTDNTHEVHNVTMKTEPDHSGTHTDSNAVIVTPKRDNVAVLTETPVVDRNIQVYDDMMDTDDDNVDDSRAFTETSTTVTPSDLQEILTSNAQNDTTQSVHDIGANVTKAILSRCIKPRKCNHLIKPDKHGKYNSSDREDVDWTPTIKKQRKLRKSKSSLQEQHGKIAELNIINETGNTMDQSNDCNNTTDTKVHPKLRKNEMKRKKDRKVFMCDICGRVIKTRFEEDHVNRHLGFKPYICEVCAMPYGSKERLVMHMRVHAVEKGIGKYKCAECGRVYADKNPYESHIKSHSGARPLNCDKCNGTFKIMKHLKDHIRNVHSQTRPICCRICGKEYFRQTSMNHHMVVAHTDPTLACKYCNRMFHTKKVLHNHEPTHTGEKRHVCSVCGHGFIQRSAYFTHMMKQHGIPKAHVIAMEERGKKNKTRSLVNSQHAL